MGYRERCGEITAAKGARPDDERLHELFDVAWDHAMSEFPESATYMGHPGHDHRWTDRSRAAIDRRKGETALPLEVLASIDRSALTPDDQVSYDLFQHQSRLDAEATRFPGELLAISQMGGPQQDLAQVLAMMPRASVEDYENILSRLRSVPEVVGQSIALLREGLDEGVTHPQVTLRDIPAQIQSQREADPASNPLTTAFASMPVTIDTREQDRLRTEAAAALAATRDSFERLHSFVNDEYIPKARARVAARDLPDGEAWYAYRVRRYTTTDLSPEQIHQIGNDEVTRIRSEMQEVMQEAGWTGTFEAFTTFLRSDPRFFFDTAEALIAAYRDIAKRVDPELPKLFGRLPRMPYGVTPVPAHSERSQTTAYYMPGSPDVHRPGWFYANTYDLPSRPSWEMEALTLHEAVPGHHLQISLAQELEGLPRFRRGWSAYTAYVEGWGLYAESLGHELGFYRDPYSRFGQLVYEMWRAIRLVVDTGMHSLGWTRERAIEHFTANTGKAAHDIVVEVDRYIVWPGQALAYKIGQRKMSELRALATSALGDRFDVRTFHDTVLGAGAMPLDLLEQRVRAWVEAQASADGGKS